MTDVTVEVVVIGVTTGEAHVLRVNHRHTFDDFRTAVCEIRDFPLTRHPFPCVILDVASGTTLTREADMDVMRSPPLIGSVRVLQAVSAADYTGGEVAVPSLWLMIKVHSFFFHLTLQPEGGCCPGNPAQIRSGSATRLPTT